MRCAETGFNLEIDLATCYEYKARKRAGAPARKTLEGREPGCVADGRGRREIPAPAGT